MNYLKLAFNSKFNLKMTRTISNDKSQNHHLVPDEGFFIFVTSNLFTTLLMVSFWNEILVNCSLLSGYEHIYWILGLEV